MNTELRMEMKKQGNVAGNHGSLKLEQTSTARRAVNGHPSPLIQTQRHGVQPHQLLC
jgi:hypothetical protein